MYIIATKPNIIWFFVTVNNGFNPYTDAEPHLKTFETIEDAEQFITKEYELVSKKSFPVHKSQLKQRFPKKETMDNLYRVYKMERKLQKHLDFKE